VCVLVEMTTRAFVSSELQNGGQHLNCVYLADCPMRKLLAALDAFWRQYGTSVFSLALLVLCRKVDVCHSALVGVSNRAASRPLRLHCGGVPALDVQPSLQEGTDPSDGPARPGIDEGMEKWRSLAARAAGRRSSGERNAERSKQGRKTAFNERWQRVLNRPPPLPGRS